MPAINSKSAYYKRLKYNKFTPGQLVVHRPVAAEHMPMSAGVRHRVSWEQVGVFLADLTGPKLQYIRLCSVLFDDVVCTTDPEFLDPL